MTYYKNYILLFGGFQDTSQQTKYLQDLWIYDCQNFVWHNPVLPPAAQKPDSRSSFSFLPHDSGAVIYGGYSRVKSTTTAGKQTKGGSQGLRNVLKPMIHQDTWFLRILPPPAESVASAPPSTRWERRKKPANAPNPPRAGTTMSYHKGRGILFGGVYDVEETEEGIDSEFFDALYAWNIERNRFFQLTLRRSRAANKKLLASDRGGARRARGRADEVELLRNLAALEASGSITEIVEIDVDGDTVMEEISAKPPQPISMNMPHPRFNSQLAIQDDVLYILGGTFERGDREYTFDEMWAIDLGRLDGVKEIYRREVDNWHENEQEDSDSNDDDEESEDDESDGEGVPLQRSEIEPISTVQNLAVAEDTINTNETETEQDTAVDDDRPHPRPFESLREFFARTSNAWQDLLLEKLRQMDTAASKSMKELRKDAFDLAETKWWDCREEITALEDEQEAAGIGEVVSIADRASETGGVGRRR